MDGSKYQHSQWPTPTGRCVEVDRTRRNSRFAAIEQQIAALSARGDYESVVAQETVLSIDPYMLVDQVYSVLLVLSFLDLCCTFCERFTVIEDLDCNLDCH
jgi:hypothetical protein